MLLGSGRRRLWRRGGGSSSSLAIMLCASGTRQAATVSRIRQTRVQNSELCPLPLPPAGALRFARAAPDVVAATSPSANWRVTFWPALIYARDGEVYRMSLAPLDPLNRSAPDWWVKLEKSENGDWSEIARFATRQGKGAFIEVQIE